MPRKPPKRLLPPRRLGRRLAALRATRVLSQDAVCKRVNERLTEGDKITQGHLSKIENGSGRTSPGELRLLCEVLRADAELRDRMADLLDEVDRPAWWDEYVPHIGRSLRLLIEWGEAAHRIRCYNSTYVHGFVQTEAYAHAAFAVEWSAVEPMQKPVLVDLRMRRQQRLDAEDFQGFDLILAEAVLHHRVGSRQIMADQLRRLCEEIEKGRNVQLLPFEAGPWPTLSNLTIYSFKDPVDPEVVETGTELGAVCDEDPDKIMRANHLFEAVNSSSGLLDPRATLDRVHSVLQDL